MFDCFEIKSLNNDDIQSLQSLNAENIVGETQLERFRKVVPMSDYRMKKFIVILQNNGYVFNVKSNNYYSYRQIDGLALEMMNNHYNRLKKENNYTTTVELYKKIAEKTKNSLIRSKFCEEGSFCTQGFGRLYRVDEIAYILGVSNKSVRKYADTLEGEGYQFSQNGSGKRELFKKDLLIMKKLISIMENTGKYTREVARMIVNENVT
ncbi:GntR family transcriptional regulator [Planococcus sp. 4-30]|uniref:GntR family transcriptional regulator n=1 Tax=Planococcus sp. 4-30 TaxID=2874583 RepID=UPI001CBAA3E2|nr:GntR family transcriptional regulator [Planococcus sp. 4-30]